MIENKLVFKNKELQSIDSRILGISGENEQEKLIFSFDTFVNGTAYLEVQFPDPKQKKVFIELTKVNQTYQIEVKNSLLVCEGYLKMQLRIAETTSVWKSKQFEMLVLEAVNAIDKIDDDYPNFILTTDNRLTALEEDMETNTEDIEELQNGLAGAEVTSNKVTSLSSSSTNTQYPGAKLLYDKLAEKQTQIDALVEENTKYKAQIPTGHKKTDSVQLTDSAEGLAIENVALWGATEQAQYEGKNLLDSSEIDTTSKNGVTISYDSNSQIITLNGTCTTDNTIWYIMPNTKNIVLNGTYTLSCEVISGTITGASADTKLSMCNDSWANSIRYDLTNTSSSITANKNDTYNRIVIRVDNGVVLNNYKIRIHLAEGSSATTEPYCGEKASPNPDYPQAVHGVTGACNVDFKNEDLTLQQTAPLTLGNIELYDGDKIQISYVNQAGYKKVTGASIIQSMQTSISWRLGGTQNFEDSKAFWSNSKDAKTTSDKVVLCSHLLTVTNVFSRKDIGIQINSSKEIGVRIPNEIASTLAEFNSWISNNNVKFAYSLESPITTEITDETLLAQLETLINMKTYKGITHFDTEGEDLAPVIEFDYYKDMTTYDDRISALEARIELLEE